MGPLWRQSEEGLGVAVKDRLTASQVAAPSVRAGSDRGGSLPRLAFWRRRKQEELLRVLQRSCFSKKREKTPVKTKDVDGEKVGSEKSTPLIRISKNGEDVRRW
jgi:hypothetical protein